MLSYVVAGLVLGGIFAISATGLVITYQASGILNFAFAAMAFTVARFYYFLNTDHRWPVAPAGVLSILILGPVLGLFLYWLLFRFLAMCSTLVKVMVTIGLSTALPATCILVFGNETILTAPGLAPQPVKVYKVLGVPVTLDQIIVYACLLVLTVGGFLVLRYTDVGLRVRALVDSPALTSLSGTNPGAISTVVWVVSATLAGLAGVLVAPIVSLDPGAMTDMMITAFAAVIAARLRSIPVAALVGLGMGIANSLLQYWLPPASTYTADLITAIPFIVMVVALIAFGIGSVGTNESEGVGGALDRAIRPQAQGVHTATQTRKLSWRPAAFGFAILLGLPLLLHGFWIGLLAQGVSYGIIFLSFSLATGEGGMIWLCQGAFAAAGAFGAALLARDYHLPVLLAVLLGGLIAVPIGTLVGLLTIHMGDLYVALVTLTFGIMIDDIVLNQQVFNNNGLGVKIVPPGWAHSNSVQVYMAVGVFALVALFIMNLRRATTGMALTAVRTSASGSRTIGISVVQTKLLVSALAAFVAGIGGGMLAITLQVANTGEYATLGALVWLTVLVTQGIRSSGAALFAGVNLTLFAGFALIFLPKSFSNFVPILFGLGAIAMIKFPEGVVTQQSRQFRAVLDQVRQASPSTYRALCFGSAAYFVVLVVLLFTQRQLWWVWLVATAVVANAVIGYLSVKSGRRKPSDGPNQTAHDEIRDQIPAGVERAV